MSHGRSGKDPFIARNFVISTCLNFRLLTAYFQITSAFRKDLFFLNLTRRQKVVSSQSGGKNCKDSFSTKRKRSGSHCRKRCMPAFLNTRSQAYFSSFSFDVFFLFLFLSSSLFYSLVNDNVLYSEIELNGSVNRNAALNEPKIETKRELFFYLY